MNRSNNGETFALHMYFIAFPSHSQIRLTVFTSLAADSFNEASMPRCVCVCQWMSVTAGVSLSISLN